MIFEFMFKRFKNLTDKSSRLIKAIELLAMKLLINEKS